MGIGLAAFIDKAGTGPSGNLAKRGGLHGGWESAVVRVHSDGKVTIFAGSHSHGQGHEITFCQIAADRLGLPIDDIRLVEGDTDRIPFGNGTWGARSTSVAGTAIYRAADKVIAKAHALRRATCWNARRATSNIGTARSRCAAPTGRSASPQVADAGLSRRGAAGGRLARSGSRGHRVLRPARHQRSAGDASRRRHRRCRRPARVKLRDFYAADDCGVVINPMIVEGQVHGGLAQGIGQALTEHIVYDRDSGQLLTASFLDYAMPRAADLPLVPHRLHRDAGAEQSAGRQGRQRERHDRRAGRDRQRRDRRAVASRRARHHPADHVRDGVARAARRTAG